MQQQYFKTMSQGNFSSKNPNSSKHTLHHADNNLNDKNSFCDFEFTDQQATLIKATLPAEFWLIKQNTDQLQKAQKEVRNRYVRAKVSLDHFQSHKSKKGVKKIQDRTKHSTQNNSEKVQPNESQKLTQPQKQKKIKKNHHFKKRVSQKLLEKKPVNNEQIEEEGERSQQQFIIIEEKSLKQMKWVNGQKNSKKNQKQKQLEEGKEKKNLKQNKQLNKDIIFPEKIQINQVLQQNLINNQFSSIPIQQLIQKQNTHSRLPFPTLPSGLPRHIPTVNDEQSGSMETNSLRFLFGLPFSTPISQQINKLSEKQKNFCLNIIYKLKSHRSSQPFRLPVDPIVQGVPDYFYVVYNPMDLGTIQKKVIKDKYKDIAQFHGDMNLIFQNSYKYNLRSTKYFQAAVEFEDYFQVLLKEANQKPQQFSKQCVPKNIKPKLDTGQLDYTEQTPMKKKKKRQWEQYKNLQNFYNLNKGQILQNRRNKSRISADEHSALYSHSMINSGMNDFNGQIYMENQNNPISMKEQNSQSENKLTRLRKVESRQISKFPNESDAKFCKKGKGTKQLFAKAQIELSNLNSKTPSIQTFSLPIQPNQQMNQPSNQTAQYSISDNIAPIKNYQIIKQKQLDGVKSGKRIFGPTKGKLTKQISKGPNNRGKRGYNSTQRDKEEDSDEQYKISKNKEKKVEKDGKQLKENKEKIEQELKKKEQIEQQEQNQNNPIVMDQEMNENMKEYMYNQYMSGYNYYYNQIPPNHYNNYMMFNRRINIGSDDDFQHINMAMNINSYNNDADMANICQDIGTIQPYPDLYPYQEYMPSKQSDEKVGNKNTPVINGEGEQKISGLKQQEESKNKKRNIMKFPSKQTTFPNLVQNLEQNPKMIGMEEKVGHVGPIKKENDKQKKQEKQLKMKNKQKAIDKTQKKEKKKSEEGHEKIKVRVDNNIQYSKQMQVKQQSKVEEHLSLAKSKSHTNNRNTKKQKINDHQQEYFPQYPYYHLGCHNISSAQHAQTQHQNITINNINQQPPLHPQRLVPQRQNIDINMIIQKNTQNQNYSGSTVASNLNSLNKHPNEKGNAVVNNSNEVLPSVSIDGGLNKAKPKIKNKRKNDEQYEYQSDDEYNFEEEWRIIRKNYNKPSRKARPKIHKQKVKDSSSQDYLEPRKGKNKKRSRILSFMKNNLNLSNTQIRQNVDNKQPINPISSTHDHKTTKIQDQITPKNIFIESQHQSSHLPQNALDFSDYMGILANSPQQRRVDPKNGFGENRLQQKQIFAYGMREGEKEQWPDGNESDGKFGENQDKEYGFNVQVSNMQKE